MKHSYLGYFWLPENLSNKITGTLKIDENNKIVLTTLEPVSNNQKVDIFSNLIQLNVIHGIVITSETKSTQHKIILYDINQSFFQSGVLNKFEYTSNCCLVGNISASEHVNQFQYLMLYSELWHDWIHISGIEQYEDDNNERFNRKYEYQQPQEIMLFSNNEFDIYIYFRAIIKNKVFGEVLLSEKPFLNVRFKESKDFIQLKEFKTCFDRLLAVLRETSHSFEKIDLKSIDKVQYQLFYDSNKYYNGPFTNNFTFDVFYQNSQKIINKWFTNYNSYKILLNTFFFAYGSKQMDIQNKFLNYIFSLELYHRKTIKESLPLSKSNQLMYNKTIESTNGDVQSWLLKVLNKDRDVPIKLRLEDIFTLVESYGINKPSFIDIKRLVDTRHYLVHLDGSKEKVYSAFELVQINDYLSSVVLRLLHHDLINKK
ncbi:MAG: hypothetical protein U0U66_03840 [Cytophagaceae bacterium]